MQHENQIKDALVLCAFPLVLWNCTDTFWFTEGNMEVEHENFILQEAREFFNENTMQLVVTSRSMQDDGKTRLSAGEFTPDWGKAVASAKKDLMCYDIPIDCEHTYQAVWLSTETGTPTLEVVDVYQKIVIVKSKSTGALGQYLLTLVPTVEYDRSHQGTVADLFINAGDKGCFSGVAIYSIPGVDLIVRANRYTNGVKDRGVHMSGTKKEMDEKVFWLKSILRPFQLIRCPDAQSRGMGEDLIIQWIMQGKTVVKVGDDWIFSDENGEQFRMMDCDGDGEPDALVILPENGDGGNSVPDPDPDAGDDIYRCPRCNRIGCDGNCVTSGGGGSGSGNNPNQVNATVLTNAAKSAVDYVNEKFGKTKAYCNRGVARAFEILFGDSKFHNMNANTMVQYWEDHPESWHSIPMSQAQNWANQGYFVVAGWINPSGESGHVVVVVPGEGLQHSGWGGKIPHVMDTGTGKRTVGKTINYSFGKGKISSIKYYVYK